MKQKKIDYLALAKSSAKAGHNMFVFMNHGYEMTLPGNATDEDSRRFTANYLELLQDCITKALEQGQDVPDFLPLEHGMNLNIRPWKDSIVEGEIDGDR